VVLKEDSMSNTPLKDLVMQEPWRYGAGLPKNALDPMWIPNPLLDQECHGELDWDMNGWWVCQQCGRIGSTGYTRHTPVQHPLSYFIQGATLYAARKADAVPWALLAKQTLFVLGVALRQAAVQPVVGYARMAAP
jgi:hypothetical protein